MGFRVREREEVAGGTIGVQGDLAVGVGLGDFAPGGVVGVEVRQAELVGVGGQAGGRVAEALDAGIGLRAGGAGAPAADGAAGLVKC